MENLNQLKTFQDACQVEGLDADQVISKVSTVPERDRKSVEAFTKLVIIARAANRLANNGQEWKPDWNDYGQYKYYPWFEMGGSSGFRFNGCAYWYTLSDVGSRLAFISREVAVYVGKQFVDVYKDFMVIE